jgi:hypothetical protein
MTSGGVDFGDEVARIAVLALTYHELGRYWSIDGRPMNADEIALDVFRADSDRDDASLLALIGSKGMTEMDWSIIHALDRPDILWPFFKDLAKEDPLRAEAVLHALDHGVRRRQSWEGVTVPAGLALRAGQRWERVVEAMSAFLELGIAQPLYHDASEFDALCV